MKRLICVLLSIIICAAVFTACGEKKEGHKVLFRDDMNSEKVVAKLIGADGKTETVEPEQVSKSDDSTTYALYGDTKKYNKVIFTCDDSDLDELAFNDYVSGWYNSPHGIYPFTENEKEKDVIDYAVKVFKYDSYEKEVYICTPDGYDKKAKDKYPVIYMTDGQNLFERGATSYGSWGVYESVKSMEKNTGKGAVIVGIANPSDNRDKELTPDIGTVTTESETYENGKGKQFSDFLVNKVVPYVEKNYNVATNPENVAICGSSSGGIESFYIGMEHPEKFGTIGALSPAFGLYNNDTWVKYLKSKKFKDNFPKVYLYCGEANDLESQLISGTKAMPENLKQINYPKKNIYETYCKKAMHNEKYWRYIFPDFLKFFRK